MDNIILQMKGAGKLLLVLNIILAIFNFEVLRDNRHVSLLILGERCQAVAADSGQMDAFNQFKPE